MNRWGYTDKLEDYLAGIRFRVDAVLDGWVFQPTYENSEPLENAWKGVRDGFIIQGITRDNTAKKHKHKFEVNIAGWAPDSLAIRLPFVYNWEEIKAQVNWCRACERMVDETHRVGFAGRVCAGCLPAERKRIETPGWTN